MLRKAFMIIITFMGYTGFENASAYFSSWHFSIELSCVPITFLRVKEE